MTSTTFPPGIRARVNVGPHVLYLGDALAVLDEVEPFDGLVTDPPYSSGGAFRGDRSQSSVTKYLDEDFANAGKLAEFSGDTRDQRGFLHWCALWSGLARERAAPGSVVAVFTDWRQLPVSTDYLQLGGWLWRGVVPWSKPSCRPQKGRFAAQCEYLVWGSSGVMPFEREVGALPGFFEALAPRDREHVTEKPLEILEETLAIVKPGGLVFDPFMGSGTTGVAAARTGRRFVGAEIVPAYFDVAVRRLADAVDGGTQGEIQP